MNCQNDGINKAICKLDATNRQNSHAIKANMHKYIRKTAKYLDGTAALMYNRKRGEQRRSYHAIEGSCCKDAVEVCLSRGMNVFFVP